MGRPKESLDVQLASGRTPRKWSQKKPTKPAEYLIALRHVSKEAEETDPAGNELYEMLRRLKIDEPMRFLETLHKAEVEHKRALANFQRTKPRSYGKSQSKDGSGAVVAAASTEATAPDAGSDKALEVLQKFLLERPWEKFRE